MIEVWFYTWLLAGAGFQVSPPYRDQATCEAAQRWTEVTHLSPGGLPVEVVYPCARAR